MVITKALYQCELWSNLTVKDIVKLERSHRFCLNYVQQLSQHTNNRYTFSVINIDPLETYIDYRKLQFLGQLCRLSPQSQAKSVFHHRLLRYINKDRQCLGFVPDIFRIVRKYNLQYVLDTYIRFLPFQMSMENNPY